MSNDEPQDGKCNYHPTQDGGYCGQEAGMGTDHLHEGHCKFHGGCAPGGAREGAGAPEGNVNRVSHGLYAETNQFYQQVMNDTHRQLCDDIFSDYLEDYKDKLGDPPLGHESRLFEIAVNHIKIIYSDNWAVDKPRELESGNPMVDKESEEKFVEGVGPVTEYTYSETVVVGTQQKLRREDRAWLREFGLLDDPESQKADGIQNIADAWQSELERGSTN